MGLKKWLKMYKICTLNAFVSQPNSVLQSSVCCLDPVLVDLSGETFGAWISCSCCERACMGRRTDDWSSHSSSSRICRVPLANHSLFPVVVMLLYVGSMQKWICTSRQSNCNTLFLNCLGRGHPWINFSRDSLVPLVVLAAYLADWCFEPCGRGPVGLPSLSLCSNLHVLKWSSWLFFWILCKSIRRERVIFSNNQNIDAFSIVKHSKSPSVRKWILNLN